MAPGIFARVSTGRERARTEEAAAAGDIGGSVFLNRMDRERESCEKGGGTA